MRKHSVAVYWANLLQPEGSDYSSWGPEGSHGKGCNGNRTMTDFVLPIPEGMGRVGFEYVRGNNLCEAPYWTKKIVRV
jgi:hypothetical protein